MSPNSITERIVSRSKEQTGDDHDIRPILTYLGPAGTYSHQVGYSNYLSSPSTGTSFEPSSTGRV